MLGDLITRAAALVLEPKIEPLCLTSSYEKEETVDLVIGATNRSGQFSCEETFVLLGHNCHRSGKVEESAKYKLDEVTKAWFAEARLHRGKEALLE